MAGSSVRSIREPHMATTPRQPDIARRLRIAFLLCFLAGAAAIAATLVIPVDVYLLVGLPLAAMVLYILVFFACRRPAHLVEPFGDSLFHLGFLLTVTSLLVSLLPYALESTSPSAEALLARFGVALATTLFGLVGRIYFRQFTISVDQAEAEAHESLFDRTQEFSGQLEALIEQSRDTIARLNGELAQTVNSSVEGIEAAGKASIAELGETASAARQSIGQSTVAIVDQLETRMQQAYQRSTASVDQFGASMEMLKDRTAKSIEPVADEMGILVAELRNVREASTRNEERITRIFESYEMMIEKLRSAQEASERFQEKLGTRLAAVVTALESASRTVETLAGETHGVVGALGHEIDGVRETRTAMSADAAALAELRAKLSEQLNASIDRSTTSSPDVEDQPLSIDEEAFGEPPPRPAPDEDVYIPPLRARLTRRGGPA